MANEQIKVKILNVDDDEIGLYTKSRILRRADFEVKEASTGRHALELAETERPHLILLDINLPDINGFEVCRRIRSNPLLASTLILQISASYRGSSDKTFGLENGADAYLIEPIEPAELVANISALLRVKQAEEELRQANERLYSVLNSITEAYFALDVQGRFLEINPAAERLLFNRPIGELLGKIFWEEYPQAPETEFYRQFQQAVATGQPAHFEAFAGLVNRWFEAHLYPRRSQLEFYLRDITRQKGAEQAQALLAQAGGVLASSLNYETTLQAVARLTLPRLADYCSINLIELDGTVRQVAQAHEDPEKEALLQELNRRYWLESDIPGNMIHRVIQTGKTEMISEITEALLDRVLPPDRALRQAIRQLIPCSALFVPLLARGQTLGAISFFYVGLGRRHTSADQALAEELARRIALTVDNTRLYQQAQHLNTELEEKVMERTAQLERALKELDQFTHVASHDLKAPLRAMDHLAVWIAEDAGDRLPESSQIHLAKLQDRIKRLDMMLNDLLVYSRVGRHYYKNVELVDTGALVKKVIDLLEPPPGFAITVQENMPRLVAQRVLLELIFRNLIDNAIKHHHRSEGHIQISACEQDNLIKFVVTDDGPGIDQKFHSQIFEAFRVLQPRDQLQGSGMGLATVKRAVESQGGTIHIISTKGQGTSFTFTWPKN